MNVDGFVRERERTWDELEELTGRAHRHLERLHPDEVLRVGVLYRSVASDLAIARRRYRGDPIVRRLEKTITDARALVYERGSRRRSVGGFFTHEYWRRIAERPRFIVAAALLLFVPALVGALWARADAEHASAAVPGVYRSMSERRVPNRDIGRAVTNGPAMSSLIFTNNIRVTFMAFAGGILLGAGTLLVLLYNGAFLGLIAGLATLSGNGRFLYEFVVAHGVLELSCIVVAGASGLRLGWALIAPGYRPRSEVLIDEGRKTIEIVLGTMPWLVVAGLVEGFITPAGLGWAVVTPIGFGLGAIFWTLVFVLGRRGDEAVTPELEPSL